MQREANEILQMAGHHPAFAHHLLFHRTKARLAKV